MDINIIKQTEAFRLWEVNLKDIQAKALIAVRLLRLANGLKGDVQPVGDCISELRIHYGPGYRVYFQQRAETLVLLLCGGNKSSQSRDIRLTKMLARTWVDEDEEDEN